MPPIYITRSRARARATRGGTLWERFAKVATLCEAGEVYLAQHMGEQGRWVSSADKKSCMTDKLEILEYCKKVSDWSILSFIQFQINWT